MLNSLSLTVMYIVVGFFNKTNPNSNHLNLFNNHVIKEHGPLLYSSRYNESCDKKKGTKYQIETHTCPP